MLISALETLILHVLDYVAHDVRMKGVKNFKSLNEFGRNKN